ncbi:SH3 domain-containing protein [Bacillus sp. OTU530]|uniref:SH3 domain-containing protein n=1 Tax=Bacillus sp. OTU530 TaxID=3043862 RepID=UPI00313BDB2F
MKRLWFSLILLLAIFLPQEPTQAASTSSQVVIVNTATNKLALYENGSLVREFSVGTGKSSTPTPSGKFTIVNKITNRPYYTRGIKGGAPDNPLGDRWMGLNINGTAGDTYAIHGNNNESSVGKWITGGCIRMHNADIHWLYDRLNTGATVLIKRAQTSYEAIASSYGVTLSSSAPVVSTPISNGSGTGRTTASVNIRNAPSITATRITTLLQNTTVTIYETRNGWYRVTANSVSGWVSSQYITVSNTNTTPNGKSGKTTTALNVRTAPGTTNSRITTLQSGTTISISETRNGWYHISANGASGWVSADYVRIL